MKTSGTTTGLDAKGMTWEPAGGAWPRLRFDAIGRAWGLYRSHWKVWSLTMLVAFICSAIINGIATGVLVVGGHGMLGGLVTVGYPRVPFLSSVVGVAIGGYFAAAMIRMALAQLDGRSPQLEDLFHVPDAWLDVLIGSMLLGTILYIGSGLLILPGLVAAGLLMFLYPLILEARLPATGAMIQSFEALKSQWLTAAVLHLVIMIVAGIGIVFFGIGVLVTGPIYALSIAVLYRDFFPNVQAPLSWKPRGFDEID